MAAIPGAYFQYRSSISKDNKPEAKSSNVFSRLRRLSPHPAKSSSGLMSLYSVDTEITTSSIESLRQRYYNLQSTKEITDETNMAAAVTRNSRLPQRTSEKKCKLPEIYNTGTFLGVSNEIFPDQNWTTKRYFQKHNRESLNEWDIMKDCDKGKTCHWNGVHRHIMTSFDYNSLKHRPNVLHLQRNEIPEASKGDKSYQTPEYASDFHKTGSTRPIPNFGRRRKSLSDTYIPLVEPLGRRKTFAEKEKERQIEESVSLVHDLESWRPATPLQWRPSKNLTRAEQMAAYHQQQQQQQLLSVPVMSA